MPQTSVSSSLTKAFAGMKGDSRKDGHDRSFVNAEASAEIPFGVAVAHGSTDEAAILPADANSKLAGVVVHSHAYDKRVDFGTTGLKPKVSLSVMRKGSIWVQVEETVAPGEPVFARHTASGGNTTKGLFRNDADSATCTQLGNSKFLTAATAGNLALVDVDV